MIKINLLPIGSIKKEENYGLIVLSVVVLSLCLAGLVFSYLLKLNSYNGIKQRTQQAQMELNKYESIVRQVEEMQAIKTVLETKKNVISLLRQKGILYPQFMEDLTAILPDSIAFRSIATQITGESSISVQIEADSIDNYPIADFISALERNANFYGVVLGPIARSQKDNMTISSFGITFNWKCQK